MKFDLQRRKWLRTGAMTAGALAVERSMPAMLSSGVPALPVARVLLITKCHLDVGFTMTQQKVLRQYFDVHFPKAMRTAAATRATGPDRYVWTTGSWLLYEYLEQASTSQRKEIEAAVAAGDLTWHALPFTWQTEMLDRSMVQGSLGFSAALDARFGRKTTGAKMTDVPGHTRGIIAPLQAAGINLLDIGVNPASTPPDVPEAFLWKDSAGNTLPVLYHRMDYGSNVQVPGTDTVIAVVVRGDNSGPHTLQEIAAIYTSLRASYPGASITASSLNDAASVMNSVQAKLPIVKEEIGDTWIYGVASDPAKVSRFRAVSRLRQKWITANEWEIGSPADLSLLSHVLLTAEHTWGTDTKTYLDNEHYRPEDLAEVIDTPGYAVMTASWQEKRDNLDAGIATLPAEKQHQAELVLANQSAMRPDISSMLPFSAGRSSATRHFRLNISPETGAINLLQDHQSGRVWASQTNPLALLTYQMLSATQYTEYLTRYVRSKEDWAPRDFGKPGIEKFDALDREWHPRLKAAWQSHDTEQQRILLDLTFARTVGAVAPPQEAYLDIRLPYKDPRIDIEVTLLGKEANRMPEALWLTFQPAAAPLSGWNIIKSGEKVGLGEVIAGGGRAMHAAMGGLFFHDRSGALTVQSKDAPVVAIGERSPLNFAMARPTTAGGLHFGLFNNAWGTNYPQWCSGNWRFRFSLLFGSQLSAGSASR